MTSKFKAENDSTVLKYSKTGESVTSLHGIRQIVNSDHHMCKRLVSYFSIISDLVHVCTFFHFIYFPFFFFFFSPDFHELWYSRMSTRLFTEIKQQWATSVLELVTASMPYLFL